MLWVSRISCEPKLFSKEIGKFASPLEIVLELKLLAKAVGGLSLLWEIMDACAEIRDGAY